MAAGLIHRQTGRLHLDLEPVFCDASTYVTKLLPDLKRQGKTVVVITHNDQYLGIADRCIKLVDGQLIDQARGHFYHMD